MPLHLEVPLAFAQRTSDVQYNVIYEERVIVKFIILSYTF